MASQIIKTVSDDLDPDITEDVQEVSFALNGVQYTIDLGKSNREVLETALATFIDNAQIFKPTAVVKASTGNVARKREENQKIREWARAQGDIEVSERGRIPQSIIDAYAASQTSQSS